VDAGRGREFRRRHRPAVGQRLVEAELVAEIHGEEIERLDASHEELAHERVSPLLGGR